MYLLIECKKSSKPWVFFSTSCEDEISRDFTIHSLVKKTQSTTSPRPQQKRVGGDIASRMALHHYFNRERWARTYHEPFKKSNGEHQVAIFTAINSVVNATMFYMAIAEKMPGGVDFYYPVIVFDGQLFEAEVLSKEDVELKPVNHVLLDYRLTIPDRLDWNGMTEHRFIIDVISDAFVQDYASIVINDAHKMLGE
jgi:hypothetical protein